MKQSERARETQWQQNHPKAGGHYSPRSLFRGLKVPYNTKPGRTRIHKKEAHNG